jgi:hypothetical protein
MCFSLAAVCGMSLAIAWRNILKAVMAAIGAPHWPCLCAGLGCPLWLPVPWQGCGVVGMAQWQLNSDRCSARPLDEQQNAHFNAMANLRLVVSLDLASWS